VCPEIDTPATCKICAVIRLLHAKNASAVEIHCELCLDSGIATGYRLDDQGVRARVLVGSRIFTSPHCPDQLWGPPKLLSNGYWGAFSPGVKQLGHEADHSPPTIAEVKKMRIYTDSPICLRGVVLNYLSTGITLRFTFMIRM
jgi:hypothetical protein